jgi:hypothetical protein
MHWHLLLVSWHGMRTGAGKPVTELRRSLPPGRVPWTGRRLVLPMLRLSQLLGQQIPDKYPGNVLGGQLAASDGFADVVFPEHFWIRLWLTSVLSERVVAEHGGCQVTGESERCQRE